MAYKAETPHHSDQSEKHILDGRWNIFKNQEICSFLLSTFFFLSLFLDNELHLEDKESTPAYFLVDNKEHFFWFKTWRKVKGETDI